RVGTFLSQAAGKTVWLGEEALRGNASRPAAPARQTPRAPPPPEPKSDENPKRRWTLPPPGAASRRRCPPAAVSDAFVGTPRAAAALAQELGPSPAACGSQPQGYPRHHRPGTCALR